jgi:PAS domain S-box-containing protein
VRQERTSDLNVEVEEIDSVPIAESSVVAAFTVSVDGTLQSVNATFAKLLGASSRRALVGKTLDDLVVAPRDWGTWRESAMHDRERDVTISLSANGLSVMLRGDLRPIASDARGKGQGAATSELVGIFVDVTEQNRLRAALQRSARMEALGSLTSGIAHDFNNLLTVLVGNLYLVAEDLRDRPKTFEMLKSARDAAKRGADLIRQLLSFARRETVETSSVDPVKVIEGLVPLLQRALGARILLSAKLQGDAGTVRCSAAQLESVLVNLSVNARDAIESDGNVVISLERARLTPESAARYGLRCGDFVEIAVADDGAGIPDSALNRVFEPFFTTKSDRGGTGLGLSMVRWFAEQSGGVARIESVPGRGTTVTLVLPRSTDGVADTSAMTMPLSTLPSGSESVLVFSRDEGLSTTIRQILEVLGYDVHMSREPAETLEAVRTKDIDLLLMDAATQQVPAQRRLLRESMAVKPQLKVIIATDGADVSRTRVPEGVAVIGKPFSLAELASTLRKVLK